MTTICVFGGEFNRVVLTPAPVHSPPACIRPMVVVPAEFIHRFRRFTQIGSGDA
jgi:hypothetical protein